MGKADSGIPSGGEIAGRRGNVVLARDDCMPGTRLPDDHRLSGCEHDEGDPVSVAISLPRLAGTGKER